MKPSKFVLIGSTSGDHNDLKNSVYLIENEGGPNFLLGCTTAGYNPNKKATGGEENISGFGGVSWSKASSPPWVLDEFSGGASLKDANTQWLLLGFEEDSDYNKFLNENHETLVNCLSVTIPAVSQ